MWAECNPGKLVFGRLGRRRVEAAFDGGAISSDGGLLLLREIADRHGLFTAAASCFTDHRKSSLIELPTCGDYSSSLGGSGNFATDRS